MRGPKQGILEARVQELRTVSRGQVPGLTTQGLLLDVDSRPSEADPDSGDRRPGVVEGAGVGHGGEKRRQTI